ncbi:MAG: DMT family transporter [Terriglobales bacterium]
MSQINSSPANGHRRFGLLSGIVSGACYGGMVFLIHITAGGAPASEITFLRALCAVVVLLPFIARHGRMWFERSSLLLWTRSVVGAVSVLCLTWNLQHTTVGFANTLFNLAPIFVVPLGAMWGQEKLTLSRFVNIVLVVLASTLFWHGSRPEVNAVIWTVGLGGMCAAAIAYSLLKSLPSAWSPLDITWCLNLATLPVALLFKNGPWILPLGKIGILLGGICALSLVGNALANVSFQHLELSTATALIPSAIIWGVLLDMIQDKFPAVQGIAGCLLYLVATIQLAMRAPVASPPMLSAMPAELTD